MGMTADERIEKLLNRFGQTISDLPKPSTGYYAYGMVHRKKANYAAKNWDVSIGCDNNEDYICHLCDVIDRMEVALETATRLIDCMYCENRCDEGYSECFRIADRLLTDVDIEGQ